MKRLIIALSISLGLYAQAPVPPAQPSTSPYAVSALDLFPTYTRATYLAATGTQAPPYDITRPTKTWYDSTATSSVTYSVWNGSEGSPAFVPLTLSAAIASSVNLPGLPTFTPYVTPASNVNIVSNASQNGAVSGYGAVYQCTLASAQALAAAIGGVTPVERLGPLAPNSPFSYVKIDPNNPVSIYFIGLDNAGQLLQQWYANGIGDPGTWSKSATGHYSFSPATLYDGTTTTLPPTSMPVRGLLANEQLESVINGLFGPVAQVVRTDLGSPTPSAPGTSGLSAADEATLNHILKILQTVFPGN